MTSSAATNPERTTVRAASAALALLLCALFLLGPWTPTARAEHAGLPSPCDLPVVTNVCGAVGSGATVQPQQSWRTEVVSLIWENGSWKVSAFRSADGPTPPLSSAEIPATPGQLFAAIPRYDEFSRDEP